MNEPEATASGGKDGHMETHTEKALTAVLQLLPQRIAGAVERACDGAAAEEIRLRVALPPHIVAPGGDRLLEPLVFTREDASELLERICRRSVYSKAEELKNGFVTLDGGARVGVCGRPVTENGRIVRLTDVSCFNFRITREVIGCAENIMGFVSEHGRPVSTLIAAPPGGGKTTLLRDIARCFSVGAGVAPCKVAVADERGELAGCVGGAPSFYLGPRTDVMELAPKAQSIGMLIRTMSPELIVTDEIGGEEDAAALAEAVRCGAAVIASAHASSAAELFGRRALAGVLDSGVFGRALLLRRNGSLLHISPLKL